MLFKDLVFLGVLPRMVANWKWKRENSSERSDKLVIVICQTSHWFGGRVWQLENLLGICWGYHDECLKQVVWRSSRNKNIAIRWISIWKPHFFTEKLHFLGGKSASQARFDLNIFLKKHCNLGWRDDPLFCWCDDQRFFKVMLVLVVSHVSCLLCLKMWLPRASKERSYLWFAHDADPICAYCIFL